MAAVLAVLRHVRPRRIALPADVYHGVRSLFEAEAAEGTFDLVDAGGLTAGDLWWLESPSNPRCRVTDVAATVRAARAVGAVVAVDSTFATPVLQQPLALGADYVVHSATKFIAGHSDALGGIVAVASSEEAAQLRHRRTLDGATIGSLDVWLALRGVRTLPLRVERQAASAATVAAWLDGRVPTVWHPSLPSHPDHAVAQRQMAAGGGVLSFEMSSGRRAEAVVDRVRVFRRATSLGGVESLAEWRRSVNPQAPEGLIRLSIGLEAPADLVADLDQAMATGVDPDRTQGPRIS